MNKSEAVLFNQKGEIRVIDSWTTNIPEYKKGVRHKINIKTLIYIEDKELRINFK